MTFHKDPGSYALFVISCTADIVTDQQETDLVVMKIAR